MHSQIIAKGFSHFDKDHSGFIEAHEISAAVQHMMTIAHLPQVPTTMLDSVFKKVRGCRPLHTTSRADHQSESLLHMPVHHALCSPLPVSCSGVCADHEPLAC
jgi:hypothetical protein